MIIILILLIPMAGILIITTLMHNVKAEAITGDNDKTKIKVVSGDKDENLNVNKLVLKPQDYYAAYASALAHVTYNSKLPLSQTKPSEVKTVNKPHMLKPNVLILKYIIK